jgi:hypothetical protein
MLTLAAIGLVGVFAFTFVLAWWWQSAVFRGSSRVFLGFVLFGGGAGYISLITMSMNSSLGTSPAFT